jgi:hypothetical protein
MEGKMKLKVGRFNCHADYKIVGLTNRTNEDFNRLLAKEECKNVEKC